MRETSSGLLLFLWLLFLFGFSFERDPGEAWIYQHFSCNGVDKSLLLTDFSSGVKLRSMRRETEFKTWERKINRFLKSTLLPYCGF